MKSRYVLIICFGIGFVGSRVAPSSSRFPHPHQEEAAAAREAGAIQVHSRKPLPTKSPEEMLALAKSMTPGPKRRQVLDDALVGYPTDDPSEILQLVEELGTWELDTRVRWSGAKQKEALLMPSKEPGRISSFNSGINVSDNFGSRIHDSVRALAQESPRAALSWLARIDVPHEHPVFQKLLADTLDLWEVAEPEAMQAWKTTFEIEVGETK